MNSEDSIASYRYKSYAEKRSTIAKYLKNKKEKHFISDQYKHLQLNAIYNFKNTNLKSNLEH